MNGTSCLAISAVRPVVFVTNAVAMMTVRIAPHAKTVAEMVLLKNLFRLVGIAAGAVKWNVTAPAVWGSNMPTMIASHVAARVSIFAPAAKEPALTHMGMT
jgi:hypothetical protein